MNKTGVVQTTQRPWGSYTGIDANVSYQVKRIIVKPAQSLSLQYHLKRSEHWVIVQGIGIIQIGDTKQPTKAGEYRYIPLGEKHRLSNTGDNDLVLIEVQCGSYLGEDDIVRLSDDYGRT
jgi:mannose-1-phosphate guanylyltransferase / mannose-6-phosphate isomerase